MTVKNLTLKTLQIIDGRLDFNLDWYSNPSANYSLNASNGDSDLMEVVESFESEEE